jgi:PAS domain S-box-containing protein
MFPFVVIGWLVLTSALIVGVVALAISRRAERRSNDILRGIPDLMFVIRRDGTYVDYSARNEKLLFASPSVFLGRTVRDIMPPPLAETFMDAIERVFQNDETVAVEYELPLYELRHFEGRVVRVGPDRVLTIVRDTTDAKRAATRNLELAGRLIASQEAERRRIARELHDDVSQRMALLTIGLDQLKPHCDADGQRIQTLSESIRQIALDLGHLSHELHPSRLQALGLVPALRLLCQDVSHQRNLQVLFTHDLVPDDVDADVSLCLYRITQEGLQNVARHSQAREAEVHLAADADCLTLSIADSGVGFDSKTAHAGLGLVSMRERAALLGGHVVIHTSPGGGTRIGVRVPGIRR